VLSTQEPAREGKQTTGVVSTTRLHKRGQQQFRARIYLRGPIYTQLKKSYYLHRLKRVRSKERLAQLAVLGLKCRAAERWWGRPGPAKRAHRGRQRRSTRRVEQGRDPSACVCIRIRRISLSDCDSRVSIAQQRKRTCKSRTTASTRSHSSSYVNDGEARSNGRRNHFSKTHLPSRRLERLTE
jgi:hypothetical protein